MRLVSPAQTDQAEFSFPLWCKVAAPTAVDVGFGGLLAWALWSRDLGLGAWLAIAAVAVLVAAEAHKRSMAVVVTEDEVVERDLLGQRVLPLAHLERVRLFRNSRLWFYFRNQPKPVWVIRGMGDLRAAMELVVSRAQAHGVKPEVVVTDKA